MDCIQLVTAYYNSLFRSHFLEFRLHFFSGMRGANSKLEPCTVDFDIFPAVCIAEAAFCETIKI